MNYEYAYYVEELLDGISGFGGVSSTLGLIGYVLSSLAIYTIAQRRGIQKAWLAWLPVLNVWILGSISDQYRYVVKEQVKSKRKILLALNLANFVLSVLVLVRIVATVVSFVSAGMRGASNEALARTLINGILVSMMMSLPLLALSIAAFVLRAMALYDLYGSCEPDNSVLYLVLSLIPGINQITQPLFLFLCREKDGGMPPRREEAEPAPEPDYHYTEL